MAAVGDKTDMQMHNTATCQTHHGMSDWMSLMEIKAINFNASDRHTNGGNKFVMLIREQST